MTLIQNIRNSLENAPFSITIESVATREIQLVALNSGLPTFLFYSGNLNIPTDVSGLCGTLGKLGGVLLESVGIIELSKVVEMLWVFENAVLKINVSSDGIRSINGTSCSREFWENLLRTLKEE
jgi:hypothetical protein